MPLPAGHASHTISLRLRYGGTAAAPLASLLEDSCPARPAARPLAAAVDHRRLRVPARRVVAVRRIIATACAVRSRPAAPSPAPAPRAGQFRPLAVAASSAETRCSALQ